MVFSREYTVAKENAKTYKKLFNLAAQLEREGSVKAMVVK